MSHDPQMRWLRLWTDIVDDEKLLLLAAQDRWYYVAILALKRSGVLDSADTNALRERKIALRLRVTSDELYELRKRLVEVNLIDANDWQPVKWEARQFNSDQGDGNAAARMRRYRERKKLQRNAVTPKLRPETEQSRDRAEQREECAKRASKRAPSDFDPDRSYALVKLPDMDVDAEIQKFRDWEFKRARSDWPATWRNWVAGALERGQYARKSKSEVQVDATTGQAVRWS